MRVCVRIPSYTSTLIYFYTSRMHLALRLWLPRLALPAILLLTLIAYGQVIGFDFVDWDDTSLVLGNPLVQNFSFAVFWSFEPELYSPLSLLSFGLNTCLWALSRHCFTSQILSFI